MIARTGEFHIHQTSQVQYFLSNSKKTTVSRGGIGSSDMFLNYPNNQLYSPKSKTMKLTNKLTTKLLSLCLVTVSMLGMLLGFPTQAQAQTDQTIQVLVAIDAQSILDKYCDYNSIKRDFENCKGTPNNPYPISKKYVHMLVKDDNVNGAQGKSNLNIKAHTGDRIEWYADTFSKGSKYEATLYSFQVLIGKNIVGDVRYTTTSDCFATPTDGFATKTPRCAADVIIPGIPNITFKPEDKDFSYWRSDIRETGTATYTFYFTITDRKGNPKGFFKWDPYITVVES